MLVTAEEKARFVEKLVKEIALRTGVEPDSQKVEAKAMTLISIAKRLHRSYEVACNREQRASELSREEAMEKAAKELVEDLNLKGLSFNSDPRGVPLKIHVEHVNGDDWGDPRRLLCVPC